VLRGLTAALGGLAPIGLAAAAAAQVTGLQGRVLHGVAGGPVSGVEVRILGREMVDSTGADGRFGPFLLPTGDYLVRIARIGYQWTVWEVHVPPDSLVGHDFEIEPLVTTLEPLTVEDERRRRRGWLDGYESRAAGGRGQFITPQDIDRRQAAALGDLLRTHTGLRMTCDRRGCAIRMTRAGANCIPTYFLDGFPATPVSVERMPVLDIHGVEIYNISEVPIEFQRTDLACGVIAVWTRRGPPPR
jgi:hypothetical protein